MGSNSSKLTIGLAVLLYVTYTQNQTLLIQIEQLQQASKEKEVQVAGPKPRSKSEVSPSQLQRCLEESQRARLKQVPGQQVHRSEEKERKVEIRDKDDSWMDAPNVGTAGKKKLQK